MGLLRYSIFGRCRNYIISRFGTKTGIKFYNDFVLGPTLIMSTPIIMHNFVSNKKCKNYPVLLCRKVNDSGGVSSQTGRGKGRENSQRKAGDPIVSVIKENGEESVMKLSEAEKFAKIKNLRLVKDEGSRIGKEKYKLEKRLNLTEPKSKTQGKEIKKIILREEIQSNDLGTKINHMLRFLEKGLSVVCVVETPSKTEKGRQILSGLENSKLKDHIVKKNDTNKGFNLVMKKKFSEDKSDKSEGQSEDHVESSKIMS